MNIYRARWLIPVEGAPVEDGVLAVEAGRIVAVDKAAALRAHGPVNDLGDCLLLPGFINAHTHLELSCYRDRLPPGPFWDWIEGLIRLRRLPDTPARERAAVTAGAAESLACGVTCVGDISRQGLHVERLRRSPIRKVCYVELMSGALQPPNDIASLADRFEALSEYADPDRLRISVSPHAPYSVTPSDLRAVAEFARHKDVGVTMHVAETPEEIEWLARGGGRVELFLSRYGFPTANVPPGASAIDRLAASGLLAEAPLLAHVNYIDDASLTRLATSNAAVVWCPRAHAFFGHAGHRWRDLLAAGVNVCVGTDSLASNRTLSILDELRFVRRHYPEADPNVILEMGTVRGANALRLDDQIGSLQPGKWADFVRVPWIAAGAADPVKNLLDGDRTVGGTWVAGQRVA